MAFGSRKVVSPSNVELAYNSCKVTLEKIKGDSLYQYKKDGDGKKSEIDYKATLELIQALVTHTLEVSERAEVM